MIVLAVLISLMAISTAASAAELNIEIGKVNLIESVIAYGTYYASKEYSIPLVDVAIDSVFVHANTYGVSRGRMRCFSEDGIAYTSCGFILRIRLDDYSQEIAVRSQWSAPDTLLQKCGRWDQDWEWLGDSETPVLTGLLSGQHVMRVFVIDPYSYKSYCENCRFREDSPLPSVECSLVIYYTPNVSNENETWGSIKALYY